MFPLFLVLMLQTTKQPNQITKPQTATVTVQQTNSTQPVNIARAKPTIARDDLNPHAQIEYQLGGHEAELGSLKEKVGQLETKRERLDRPDIDDLKLTRERQLWAVTITATVLGTIITIGSFLRKFLERAFLAWSRRKLFPETQVERDD